MENKLSDLIIKSLKNYDENNYKHRKYLKNKNYKIDKEKSKIIFKDKKFDYELLGIFDNDNNIWMWGWMFPNIKINKSSLSRKLLNYALDIEVDENSINYESVYLKIQFLNSRFLLENNLQLDIHLALSTYLLKDNIKFILPNKLYLGKNRYITRYFLVK